MESAKKTVAMNIARFRKQAGMTQSEFAERLSVTPQAVSKWECGQSSPDLDLLSEMAAMFDIQPGMLLNTHVHNCNQTRTTSETIIATLEQGVANADRHLIGQMLAEHTLSLEISVHATDKRTGKQYASSIPVEGLSPASIEGLSPFISDALRTAINHIPKEIRIACSILACPKCGSTFVPDAKGSAILCSAGHRFALVDGVIDFGTREIPGELWSLTYRNYEHYYKEATWPELPVYHRGEIFSEEVKWREIEKSRPRIILDVASGTGSGIKYTLERINWDCTVVLTDISHRILAWNRQFLSENLRNPHVRLLFLACDCSCLPIRTGSIDCITSRSGFESMREKMKPGFQEAYRVLKPSGQAIYDMSVLGDRQSLNTGKWLSLLRATSDHHFPDFEINLMDEADWKSYCDDTGYVNTGIHRIYHELAVPETDVFPFENMVLRWMGLIVCVSEK